MNELSLVIQSICLEAAVGLLFFLALFRLQSKNVNGKTASIAVAVLVIVGVGTSITHLGQPLRAFNSLLNLGSSWMSRETLCVALLVACCVLLTAINLWKPNMKTAISALEWAGVLIGLVLLYIIPSIYTFASVPVWDGANTYIECYTTAVILGALLFFALTFDDQNVQSNRALSAVTFVALAVQIISSELHTAALGVSESTAAAMSVDVLSGNGTLIAVKWSLLVVGIGAFCLMGTPMAFARHIPATAGAGEAQAAASAKEALGASNSFFSWISVCAVFAAAFIGKVLFFASMVTTSIGMP